MKTSNTFASKVIVSFNINRTQVGDFRNVGLLVFNEETANRFTAKVNTQGIEKLHSIMNEMKEENGKMYNQFAKHIANIDGKSNTFYGNAGKVDEVVKAQPMGSFITTIYYHTEDALLKSLKKIKFSNVVAV